MKELSITVTNVNIYLLTKVFVHVTYSQYMKELSMNVGCVSMELLVRILLLGILNELIKE